MLAFDDNSTTTKKKSYNSFAVNKMMTDLGCFVITEGHVSAVIITTIVFNFFQGSANLPSSRKLWTASQQCFQRKDDPKNSRMTLCQFYAPSCICRWAAAATTTQKGWINVAT